MLVRITEIWSSLAADDSTGSFGSGYMLGAGLILTARHVLRPEGSPPPNSIWARTLEMAELQRAELVWPSMQQLGDKDAPDAALVRLPGAGEGDPGPHLGPPDSERAGETITVSATGFPRFAPEAPGERRDTEQITGIVHPGTRLVAGRYEIEDLTVRERKLAPELVWDGISGAALLADNRVIGILIARKTPDNRYDFSAERIEKLLSAPEFLDAVRGHVVLDARRPDASPSSPPMAPGQVMVLVSELANCEKLATEAGRTDVLRGMIRQEIVRSVQRRNDTRSDLMNIVQTAANYPGGLEEFLQTVSFFEGGTKNWQRVESYAATLPGLRFGLGAAAKP